MDIDSWPVGAGLTAAAVGVPEVEVETSSRSPRGGRADALGVPPEVEMAAGAGGSLVTTTLYIILVLVSHRILN